MAEPSTRVSLHGSSADTVVTAPSLLSPGSNPTYEGHPAPLPATNPHYTLSDNSSIRAKSQTQRGNLKTLSKSSGEIENTKAPAFSPELQAREPNLAHQAALRRLNGVSSNSRSSAENASAASSQSTEPVLVRTYTNPAHLKGSSRQAKMDENRRSWIGDKADGLPPLESFSFGEILASIDPEIRATIDAIAEICGRSKMSLADEYGSHLPPQGELTSLHESDEAREEVLARPRSWQESVLFPSQLPTMESRDRRSSAALALIGSSSQRKVATPGVPTAATSNVSSQFRHEPSSQVSQMVLPSNDQNSSLIPLVLAWLRRPGVSSGATENRHQPQQDYTAVDALHRVLMKASGLPEAVL